ncbi:MAG TPA: class I SAM-dependent methyltransferase [Anaerolineales bacterium]|nr:class I SAM-dependent methyltransferase [Anaerolineales bacterium]
MEVGVWKGDFAKEILERCELIDRYYMIDPWANLPDWNKPFNVGQEVFDDVYAEAMSQTAFASAKIVVLRGRTKEVIDAIPDNSLDLAYIDGDHTLRGITIDLIKLLPKIKEGGLIGGDDFTNNPWQHDVRFEPTLVCPFSIYFAEAVDLPIMALPFDQFIIQKRSEASFSFFDTMGKYSDISLNKLPPRFGKDGIKKRIKRALTAIWPS